MFSGAREELKRDYKIEDYKIGDYESKPFWFPNGKVPYTRVLALHAQCSYKTAIKKKWIDPKDEPEPPEDYGTPVEEVTFRSMVQQSSTMEPTEVPSNPSSKD